MSENITPGKINQDSMVNGAVSLNNENDFIKESLRDIEVLQDKYSKELHLQERIKILNKAIYHLLSKSEYKKAHDLLLNYANAADISTNESSISQKLNIKFVDKIWLTTPAPEKQSLVQIYDQGTLKNFIPRGIVVSLVGAGGIGKTHWLTQLALSVVCGFDFLGKYPVKRGYVFMALGENNEEDMQRLIKKTFDGLIGGSSNDMYPHYVHEISSRLAILSVAGKDSSLITKNYTESDFYKSFLESLIEMEPDEGWDLVILDPISRFLGAEAETDNAAATYFISRLENIILNLKGKPTIIFGHHMSKNSEGKSQADSRGSSAITDGVRLQINLSPIKIDNNIVPNQINMITVKSNHTKIYDPAQLYKDELGCLSVNPQIIVKEKTQTKLSQSTHNNSIEKNKTPSSESAIDELMKGF